MNAASLGWAERRRYPRVALPPALGESTLRPLGERSVGTPVLDFSPGGVAVGADAAEWLREATPLSLRVGAWDIPCRLARGSSECMHASQGSPDRVGVALQFALGQKDEVAQLYHRLRFPSLHRRGAIPEAELRNLLVDSGYASLRPGLEPGEAWLNAAWSPTLSHDAVFRENGGPASGHITISRAYRNAWIGHEIAMLPRSADNMRCRRDLYQHFCVWPRLVDGEGTYVFGYYSPKRRFHQEMFEAFAATSSVDECVVVRMERYMRDYTWGIGQTLGSARQSASPMRAEEEAQVLSMMEASWPALCRTALDIGPGRLIQDCLHPSFAALGGRRARQCLVVRSGSRLLAAILCDWEDTGLSLFDALSVAHVFLAPGVETTAELEHSITGALTEFYAARGANVPMFTSPPGAFQARDVPGFKWVETMGCIVFSARALRAFEAFVELRLDPEVGSTTSRPEIALG